MGLQHNIMAKLLNYFHYKYPNFAVITQFITAFTVTSYYKSTHQIPANGTP